MEFICNFNVNCDPLNININFNVNCDHNFYVSISIPRLHCPLRDVDTYIYIYYNYS